MNAEYAALAGRIRQSLPDLARLVGRAELLMDKARRSGDSDYLDGVALNLHGFYAGVERIFEDIARNVYTFNLRPGRIQELVAGLRDCYQAVQDDLLALCSILEQLSVEDGEL
ncbi:MAG TPA: hypothetical protein ENJ31_12355 [Anaerolineae bacterium]|nr:hypothetical protein [Anaerolineae bacterium]